MGAEETPASVPEEESTDPAAETANPPDAAPDTESLIDSLSGLGEVAEETFRTLSEGLDGAEDAVRDGLEKAEATIREHPLVAVGIAAGLGFVVGLIMRGDRD